ncbi:MAG: cytochrome b/b6 domain-containing protein [Bacteroidetes bacterium]|nr:cytochrome b/b6 domain-containing protein [Bacteroidota bacterium]MCL5034940.1 cytochrome b/b6 domain-containing protein [Bacteroidota bacterium]
MVSVLLLIISGFSMKYSETVWGKVLLFLEGGFQARGALHRLSAVLLFITAIYHLIYISFSKEGRREFKSLLPNKNDFVDLKNSILYDLLKRSEKPAFGRYSYREKVQYWAFFIFIFLMFISGVILWFHDFFFGFFPKWAFDVSFALHGGTATLVILFLVLWHMYVVHLSPANFPGNSSFWHGYVTERWLKENHSLEYEEMKGLREGKKSEGKED